MLKDLISSHYMRSSKKLYNEASQYVDDLAERILAIGGNPVGTLKESLEISIVDEAGKNYSAEQMVEAFSNDLTHISEQLVKSIEVAGEAGDDVSEDMFIGMKILLINTIGCSNHI